MGDRGERWLPQRYSYVDLVAYTLTMTKIVESQKPFTYREAVTSNESNYSYE